MNPLLIVFGGTALIAWILASRETAARLPAPPPETLPPPEPGVGQPGPPGTQAGTDPRDGLLDLDDLGLRSGGPPTQPPGENAVVAEAPPPAEIIVQEPTSLCRIVDLPAGSSGVVLEIAHPPGMGPDTLRGMQTVSGPASNCAPLQCYGLDNVAKPFEVMPEETQTTFILVPPGDFSRVFGGTRGRVEIPKLYTDGVDPYFLRFTLGVSRPAVVFTRAFGTVAGAWSCPPRQGPPASMRGGHYSPARDPNAPAAGSAPTPDAVGAAMQEAKDRAAQAAAARFRTSGSSAPTPDAIGAAMQEAKARAASGGARFGGLFSARKTAGEVRAQRTKQMLVVSVAGDPGQSWAYREVPMTAGLASQCKLLPLVMSNGQPPPANVTGSSPPRWAGQPLRYFRIPADEWQAVGLKYGGHELEAAVFEETPDGPMPRRMLIEPNLGSGRIVGQVVSLYLCPPE